MQKNVEEILLLHACPNKLMATLLDFETPWNGTLQCPVSYH